MTLPKTRAALLAASAVALVGALSACGSSAVPQSDVEDSVTAELTAEDGSHPDSTSCPEDLPAEKGASMTCSVSDVDGDFDVLVTVSSVDGDTANYDIELVE
jgi:hypothetical protein